MKEISITKAHYLREYKVQLFFNDNKRIVVDFGKFLRTKSHPAYNKYKRIDNFKKFKIESGNIVWGNDWGLIFPVDELYRGEIKC